MVETWVNELLVGLGRFFLNPLFYIILLFSFFLGFQRTKQERKDFNSRIHSTFLGWSEFVWPGIIVGFILTVVMLALGIVIPVGFLFLTSILTAIFILTKQLRWLSPAYIVGLAIIFSLFLPKIEIENEWLMGLLAIPANNPIMYLAIMLTLLMLAEGFLILKKGYFYTSPKLKKSKRGKSIGTHVAKKLWMVPMIILIPGEGIHSIFEWWPVFTTPYETFSFLAIPVGIGFQQQVQSTLPKEAIQMTGRRVLGLSLIVMFITIGAYWFPILAIAAAVVAIIGRELIIIRQKMIEENNVSFFATRSTGIVILGVIPDSPAYKMSLQVGEIVTKVNGKQVRNEKEFYEALQVNRAFCKLEVLDYNGEIRFAQRALYDGEHHELGLLFVHDEKQWTTEAV